MQVAALTQVGIARRALRARVDSAKDVAPRRIDLETFRERYKSDPGGFYAYCDLLEIKPKEAQGEGGRIPFKLTQIQRAYCETRTPRDVILKARQVKITSIELARDTWFFLTKEGVAVRVVCQSSTDHEMLNELSDRINVIFESLRKNAKLDLKFERESKQEWTLANGSSLKIVEAGASEAAAQKKGRGSTVHRIHTTEIAFWEYAGHTLNAMLEAIAGPEHGTEIVHESTPNGAAGAERGSAKDAPGGAYFYWLCEDARQKLGAHAFHFFSWLQCEEYRTPLEPGERIVPETDRERAIIALGADAEQLKWYRAKVRDKGQDDTDQEYPSDPQTCFLVSGRAFFDKAVTARQLAGCAEPIETRTIKRPGAVGTLKIWHQPERGKQYVIPVDTSEGTGGDRGGAQIYERGTGRHVATLVGQFKPAELAAESAAVGYLYNTGLLAVERNNHGVAVLQELQRVSQAEGKRAYSNLFHDLDGKPGWNNVEVRRTAALDALEQAHRSGAWSTRDSEIVGEVRTFVVNKNGKAEADKGAKDDLVLMAAIGWDVMRRATPVPPYRSLPAHSL